MVWVFAFGGAGVSGLLVGKAAASKAAAESKEEPLGRDAAKRTSAFGFVYVQQLPLNPNRASLKR